VLIFRVKKNERREKSVTKIFQNKKIALEIEAKV
jgi:hypothetical protein